MTRTQPQHSRTGSLQNGDRQSQPRDIETSQNIAWSDRRSGLNLVWHFFEKDLTFEDPLGGCLEERCGEQSESYVTERENTDNEEEALTPAKKSWRTRWDDFLFSCEFHGQ
jgi:hypothetical protein